jgi:hypothetical protein
MCCALIAAQALRPLLVFNLAIRVQQLARGLHEVESWIAQRIFRFLLSLYSHSSFPSAQALS